MPLLVSPGASEFEVLLTCITGKATIDGTTLREQPKANAFPLQGKEAWQHTIY